MAEVDPERQRHYAGDTYSARKGRQADPTRDDRPTFQAGVAESSEPERERLLKESARDKLWKKPANPAPDGEGRVDSGALVAYVATNRVRLLTPKDAGHAVMIPAYREAVTALEATSRAFLDFLSTPEPTLEQAQVFANALPETVVHTLAGPIEAEPEATFDRETLARRLQATHQTWRMGEQAMAPLANLMSETDRAVTAEEVAGLLAIDEEDPRASKVAELASATERPATNRLVEALSTLSREERRHDRPPLFRPSTTALATRSLTTLVGAYLRGVSETVSALYQELEAHPNPQETTPLRRTLLGVRGSTKDTLGTEFLQVERSSGPDRSIGPKAYHLAPSGSLSWMATEMSRATPKDYRHQGNHPAKVMASVARQGMDAWVTFEADTPVRSDQALMGLLSGGQATVLADRLNLVGKPSSKPKRSTKPPKLPLNDPEAINHHALAGARAPAPTGLSANDLVETFGIGGYYIGDWVPNEEASERLERTWESLATFADTFGVEPSHVGPVIGRIAHGAEGKGGKNAPIAHYAPSDRHINLIRHGSAGSLYHEMFHAYDHMAGGSDYFSARLARIGGDGEKGVVDLYNERVAPALYAARDRGDLTDTQVDRVRSRGQKALHAFRSMLRGDAVPMEATHLPGLEAGSAHRLAGALEGSEWAATPARRALIEALAQTPEVAELAEDGRVSLDRRRAWVREQWAPAVALAVTEEGVDSANELGERYFAQTDGQERATAVRGVQSLSFWMQRQPGTAANALNNGVESFRAPVKNTFLRDAMELDGRSSIPLKRAGSSYYTLPWEATARALETMTASRLEQSGISMAFGVSGTHPGRALADTGHRGTPYPRAEMNAGLTPLLDQVFREVLAPAAEWQVGLAPTFDPDWEPEAGPVRYGPKDLREWIVQCANREPKTLLAGSACAPVEPEPESEAEPVAEETPSNPEADDEGFQLSMPW